MKLWLISIGILLLLLAVVVGLLQSVEVQYRIGRYYEGKDNIERAFYWYYEAGKNEHAQSIKSLERLHYAGGTKKYPEYKLGVLRLLLFIKPVITLSDSISEAETGDSNGMLRVGTMLFFGIRCDVDKVKGAAWMKAITLLEKDKEIDYGPYFKSAELEMTPQEIAKSKVLAEEIVTEIKSNGSKK